MDVRPIRPSARRVFEPDAGDGGSHDGGREGGCGNGDREMKPAEIHAVKRTAATFEPRDLLTIDSTQADIAQARHAVDAVLARSCPSADRFSIILVLSELLTNAVRHADGYWRLRLRAQEGLIVVEVADGVSALPRLREPDLVDGSGGLGMHLVYALASRVEVERHALGGGKTVRALWIASEDVVPPPPCRTEPERPVMRFPLLSSAARPARG